MQCQCWPFLGSFQVCVVLGTWNWAQLPRGLTSCGTWKSWELLITQMRRANQLNLAKYEGEVIWNAGVWLFHINMEVGFSKAMPVCSCKETFPCQTPALTSLECSGLGFWV